MSRPSKPKPGRFAMATLLLAVASCTTGLGQMQTARTLPRGERRHVISTGYIYNFMEDSRGGPIPGNVILQYAGRYGLRDNLDLGVKIFFGLGALVDAKVQVVNRPRLAVSVLGGAGGAFDAYSGAGVVHAPVSLLASYRLSGIFSPYVGAGYGAFWIFNYDSDPYVAPGTRRVERAWHGDGLAVFHVGFELAITQHTAFLLEYGYLRPVVEDPGDRYEFATNHLFLTGVQF